jgi:uncharacterized repeat protein (TIGR01451 family)
MPAESPLESPGDTLLSPLIPTLTLTVAPTPTHTAMPTPTHTVTPTRPPAATPTPKPASQLRLSVSAVPAVAKRHGELTYTIRLASEGGPVHNVVITCAVPANTWYVSGSATQGGVQAQDVVRWSVPQMAANQDREFSFRVVVLSGDQVRSERYGARCDDCVSASGPPLVTPVEFSGIEIFMPLVFRNLQR